MKFVYINFSDAYIYFFHSGKGSLTCVEKTILALQLDSPYIHLKTFKMLKKVNKYNSFLNYYDGIFN